MFTGPKGSPALANSLPTSGLGTFSSPGPVSSPFYCPLNNAQWDLQEDSRLPEVYQALAAARQPGRVGTAHHNFMVLGVPMEHELLAPKSPLRTRYPAKFPLAAPQELALRLQLRHHLQEPRGRGIQLSASRFFFC